MAEIPREVLVFMVFSIGFVQFCSFFRGSLWGISDDRRVYLERTKFTK